MNNDQSEMDPRTAYIFARVKKRGRVLRRRRLIAQIVVTIAVVAVPLTAFALTTGDSDRTVRVAHSSDSTTRPPTTVSAPTTSTTPSTTSSSTTTRTTVRASTPTTVLVSCRNSRDPACGPFYYDPPLRNEAASLQVTAVQPSTPAVGQRVTFMLRASDPDSFFVSGGFCGSASFGDGRSSGCGPSCAGTGDRYGAWDPPQPRPSDVTYAVEHTYEKNGTYRAEFSIAADACGPRLSRASASTEVRVSKRRA